MQTQKLLQKVGDQHRFQIYSIAFVSIKWLFISMTVFLPSYLFITPSFTCDGIQAVQEIDACPMIDRCTIEQPDTITNYAQLYCDQKYTRNSILSSQFIGSIIGLILLSVLADQIGRKVIIVSTLCLALLGSMLMTIGSYYLIYPLIYIGVVMMGFGGYSLSMVSYSYLSEISCDLWRQRSLIMTYAFWAMGQIMLYPVISFISDWLLICFFIFVIPLLILLFMTKFIVQPPEFLYASKKYDECLQSLNAIARFNNKPEITDLQGGVASQQEPQQFKDTFMKGKYLLPLIILSLAQACNNGFYYTIQYSLDDYGYRFQLNMLVIGCLEFVSCFFTNFFCHKMKRKLWIVILMIISGAFGILVEFSSQRIYDLLLIGVSRLFNTVGFALFSLISAETFPTTIRSTGLGITEAMSNLGNMGAPFLVTLAQIIRFKAVFVGGFLNLFGGASMLLVKQTKKDDKQPIDKTDEASRGHQSLLSGESGSEIKSDV